MVGVVLVGRLFGGLSQTEKAVITGLQLQVCLSKQKVQANKENTASQRGVDSKQQNKGEDI